MDRLLEYIGKYHNDEIQEKLNRFVVDSFDLDEYFVYPEKPVIDAAFMYSDKVKFDIRIDVVGKKQNKQKDEIFISDVKKCCYINCCLMLTKELDKITLGPPDDHLHINYPSDRDRAIQVNGNLVPKDKKFPMQADAVELMMKHYDLFSIEKYEEIPIEDLVKKVGLKIEYRYYFPKDGNVEGHVCMVDETVQLLDKTTKQIYTKEFEAGTILIDASLVDNNRISTIRFALAHELYHWLRHRFFVLLRAKMSDDPIYHIVCKPRSKFWWKDDDDRVEVQADNFAGSLLLCHRNLLVRFNTSLYKHGYYYEADRQKVVDDVLKEMSKLYKVSKMTLALRYTAAGEYCPEFDKHTHDFDNKQKHFEVYPEEVFALYENNIKFRKLIDDKKFVYINKYVVLNDPKYVVNNKITAEAKNNPDKCFINFSYKFESTTKVLAYGINLSKAQKELQFDEKRNEKLIEEANKAIIDSEAFKDLITDDFAESLTNIRKYRKMHEADVAESIGISLRNYQNYEGKKKSKPKKNRALALVNLFQLPPNHGEKFYRLMQPVDKNDKVYIDIINCLYNKPLSVWNSILSKKGYPLIDITAENE